MRRSAAGPHAQAVVFDMDGVLIDSEHLWAELWEDYATASGARWLPDHTRDVQGMSAPEWAAYLAGVIGGGHDPQATERAVVDGMIKAIAGGRAPMLPGAERLLVDVASQVPVGLATSAPRRVIDAVLATYRIEHCFTGTVSSAEVARGKPGPDVYLEAAARIGAAPARCVAVEDSTNGVRAAAAAGMTVIALANHRYPLREEARSVAHRVTQSLAEVRRTLWEQLALPAEDGNQPEGAA